MHGKYDFETYKKFNGITKYAQYDNTVQFTKKIFSSPLAVFKVKVRRLWNAIPRRVGYLKITKENESRNSSTTLFHYHKG